MKFNRRVLIYQQNLGPGQNDPWKEGSRGLSPDCGSTEHTVEAVRNGNSCDIDFHDIKLAPDMQPEIIPYRWILSYGIVLRIRSLFS